MSGPIPVLHGEDASVWVRDRAASPPPAPPRQAVRRILDRVREEGDAALLDLGERLDGARPGRVRVDPARIREAATSLSSERARALESARANLERFHVAQRRREPVVPVLPGVEAWREFRPLRRVGVYVPGGNAAYPSSLLMAVVPARIAGCAEVAVCSPPGPDGLPHGAVLAAAGRLGVEEVHAAGGAQAVAALAYGTESVRPVDRIVGPGGPWVTAAKLAVSDAVSIDLPAGPSEVVAWADAGTPPDWVAADLLAQAEHGPDSLCVAILPAVDAARAVRDALRRRLDAAERAKRASESLAASALLVTDDEERALGWIETLAPEHLSLLRADARRLAARVSSAGSVFVGPWSAVAAGDYASGTNHVLPTGRRARADDGLSVDDFGRWVQFQTLDAGGLGRLAPAVETLAEWEGLPAHADSVRVRLEGRADDAARPAGGAEPGADGASGPGPPAPTGARVGRVDPAVRRLVRPHLLEAEPYVTARSRHGGGVLLDANENPFGSPVPELGEALHRYPDPALRRLRRGLAARLGVGPDQLWIGNGSDEALDLLLRVAVAPGDRVVVPVPTYGVYGARCAVHGAEVREVPLDGSFDLDVERTVAAARDARLVFLCSPNNPTGNRLSRERVLAVAGSARCLVAVDEAYVEFAGAEPASLAGRAGDPPNLAVVRTFSKAWGLAGARVGYVVAHPDLAALLSVAGLPYPLSDPARRAATLALARAEEVDRRRDRVVAERGRLRAGLETLGVRVLPSEANFLLFFVSDPAAVQARLARDDGVVVRNRSGLHRLEGGLRVSIGTPSENDRFLEALERALAGRAPAPGAGPSRAGAGRRGGERPARSP